MADTPSNNRRIAKNTIFLYGRMLVVMGLTLYTSRVILKALGFDDFGIYNLVAGMTMMFAFFTSSLSNATQRFLNIEHGRHDVEKTRKIFNISTKIYFLISIALIAISEIVGIWLIKCKLDIPADRITATVWVFQATLLALFFTFNGIVFQAVMIARENMKIYSYIGIFEAVAKLGIAFVIAHSGGDRLVEYSFLLTGVTLAVQLYCYMYCRKHYEECQFRRGIWDKGIFVDMFKFTGWNTFGCAIIALNFQGINIVLNIFFGPIVNAARAISAQIENVVNNFTNSFFTAVRPPMIKSYGAGDMVYFTDLMYFSSKIAFYLTLLMFFPIVFRVDYILHWWLGEVPEYTSEFVIWVMVYSLINILTNPLWTAIQAVNRMRGYCLIGGLVFLSAFPISCICLLKYHNPVIVFQVVSAVRLIYLFVVIRIVRLYISFSISDYARHVFLPIIKVTTVSALLCWGINGLLPQNFISLVTVGFAMMISVFISVITLGITKSQRQSILAKLFKNKYATETKGFVEEGEK